ncbi:MAG: AMP-binding protein [Chloroflexi bacterium]|nr:AMP-binding protein [Chloroflexota bacterium]
MSERPIPWGARITQLAAQHPQRTAIITIPQDGSAHQTTTWRELEEDSNRAARLFARHGLDADSLLVIGLGNGPDHLLAAIAAWKCGALVLPLSSRMPPPERDAILSLAQPQLVVSEWGDLPYANLSPAAIRSELANHSAETLPNWQTTCAHPGKAIGSGGSTGRPKIIVDPRPWEAIPGTLWYAESTQFAPRQVHLLAGPLYHNSPFLMAHWGLFEDHTLILMERFAAALAADLIEQYRVQYAFLAPTMMARIARLPDLAARDFSSFDAMYSTAAPCPPWVKRAWIELLGAEKVYEILGASEGNGLTSIRGDEWLRKPGSVGRPLCNMRVRILDDDGCELPAGEVGEIFLHPGIDQATYEYIGSPPARSTADGFVSVGDLGWLDEDGFLFLADRRNDLIISGGANIYPAEVEAVLSARRDITDVVVVGLPDEEWGKRVHAIIQPSDLGQPPAVPHLNEYCRRQLSAYKVPKSYEFIARMPRQESGKIRRSQLAQERETHCPAAIWVERTTP